WSSNMTILCVSMSLMLCIMALWEHCKSVITLLLLLCTAHWGLLYRMMFIIHVAWEPRELHQCLFLPYHHVLLTMSLAMGFNFVILCFTAIALISKYTIRTDLWKLLFNDSLVYLLVIFFCSCIPAMLNILNLNSRFLVFQLEL
ncbi:hypothetical protein EV421DRAFT_1698093, partial [Armillaria borealis]